MNDFKDEIRLMVDLDQERGIPPREGRAPNVHRVTIRKAKVVNLGVLDAYLGGKMDFDNSVLEAISKLIVRPRRMCADFFYRFPRPSLARDSVQDSH